jgi:CheY-like chemotaxis protein
MRDEDGQMGRCRPEDVQVNSKRIMIVDDDAALIQALSARCESMGLDVVSTRDGLEAVMMIAQSKPDLVILDIDMPAANGITVCENLINDRSIAPIPVIFLSGNSDPETAKRCESLGAEYVKKGIDAWTRLQPLIERHLTTLACEESSQPTVPPPMVLMVEDDKSLCAALMIRFESAGYRIETAHCGMQGFWKALKHRPDVIVTDYYMPEGTAEYLIDRLSRHVLTKETPVILMTGKRIVDGSVDPGLGRRMTSLGVRECVSKPVAFATLLESVSRYAPIPAHSS